MSSLGLKTTLNKIPLFGGILFYMYKRDQITIKFLLAGDTFMPKMHLKQPRFTYSTCGQFTKNKEFKNLKKQ